MAILSTKWSFERSLLFLFLFLATCSALPYQTIIAHDADDSPRQLALKRSGSHSGITKDTAYGQYELIAHTTSLVTAKPSEESHIAEKLDLIHRYENIFSQIEGWDRSQAAIEEISGGLTNHSYALKINKKKYFFRCSEKGILGNSLEQELLCSIYASSHEIAPKIILYSLDEGVVITDFIEQKEEALNLKDPLTLKRIVHTIRTLHNECKEIHSIIINPFRSIERYRDELEKLSSNIPREIDSVLLSTVDAIEETYGNVDHLTLCHMDLHKGNIIDDGNKIWLIDWEYGGLGDPLFDLASFASAEGFSDEEMKFLLQTYNPDASPTDFNHLYSMRIIADIRWGLWALLQKEKSTINSNYEQMAKKYIDAALERCTSEKYTLREHLRTCSESSTG